MEYEERSMYEEFKKILKKKSSEEVACEKFFRDIVVEGYVDNSSPYIVAKDDIDNFRKPSIDIPSVSKFTRFFEKYSDVEILDFLINFDMKIPVNAQLRGYEVLLKKASLEFFPKVFQCIGVCYCSIVLLGMIK